MNNFQDKSPNLLEWSLVLAFISIFYFITGYLGGHGIGINWSLIIVGMSVYCFVKWLKEKRKITIERQS